MLCHPIPALSVSCVPLLVSLALLAPAAAQEPRPDAPEGPPRQTAPAVQVPTGVAAPTAHSRRFEIPVTSSMSLVHVGSNDSFAITPEGNQAARSLFEAIGAYNRGDFQTADAKAAEASAIYDEIIPRENYGGEYSALQWFCDYLLADAEAREAMTADPYVQVFFEMYGGNGLEVLQEYLKRKYRVEEIGDEDTRAGQDRKVYLEDTILFSNPRREGWEHTSELMKLLDLKPGMRIADVGSGPGYYTFRFAERVGPEGEVIAIDTVAAHLANLERTREKLGVTNVRTIQTDGKSLGLAGEKVDAVFLCSLYHNIYAMSTAPERDAFVDAIKDARGTLPYHGPYVAKELIIAQMVNYGFELVSEHQHIPQRYLLVLRKRTPGK
jgi:SAM-dependent methyltransferase